MFAALLSAVALVFLIYQFGWTVAIFLLVLFVLILVHEWGHFIMAKKTGMRVDEFGICFPPKLFGIRRGETEYTFNAIPIGGFVKIFGEDPVDLEGDPDKERAFSSKCKPAQALVLVAGVAMNTIFAWILFAIVFMVGVQTVVPESEAGDSARLVITEVLPESPAQMAGLTEGAVVTAVSAEDGESVTQLSPSSFSTFIQDNADRSITITYERAGEEMTTVLSPQQGLIAEEGDRAAIGVGLAFVEVVARPPHTALKEATVLTVTSLREIVVGISKLLYEAVLFRADLSQVAGPVGIVGLVGEATAFGITSLLMFTAFISLNLAVINLLPFPALDGGRLLFVIIEAVKGSPIRPQFAGALNTVGFVLLILLMVAVTYNDILRII